MDPYGQVCLGNVAYQQSGTDDDREWERLLKVAFGHYKNVLKIRPSNAYAANGLGVILFERGQFNEARQVFQSVRESLPDMSPACLNLAHTLVCMLRVSRPCIACAVVGVGRQLCLCMCVCLQLAMGHHDQAAQLYRHYITRVGTLTAESYWILVYIARCDFEQGRFASCITHMKRAIRMAPADDKLW
jgi:RNA polymerase-associated protein CTR9